ncbi:MAG TPA: GWxTD domain-containing protein [Gemmatimonadales bacterium]|nr:GWxTD domain-containing protein [Gemmatimonadales bacterium]
MIRRISRFHFPASLLPRLAGAALVMLCLGTATPRAAQAQAPDQRAAIEAWRDTLKVTTDTIMLLRWERLMIIDAKADRDNTMLHLRLGFLSLRYGDLAGGNHYNDAASEFEWATQLQPTWPYAWYGLGMAELGIGDSQVAVVTGLKTMFGKDALAQSAAAYAKSAEVDPGFVQGLVELAHTALAQRVNIRLDVALAALRASAGTESASNPQVLLARGRIEREVGSPDSAVAAFMGYLSHGGDQGLGLYELGRTQLGMGLDVGAVSYYEGSAYNDTLSVPLYRKDLAYFADSTELAGFDAASGPAREAWLREFWSSRDHASLRSPNERLKEQYRRLAYVRQNFRLASVNRHYQIEEIYHSGSDEFDDRGMIYLRHGTPSDRASYSEPGIEPNETWVYRNPDGDLIFNFVSREDVQDFKLVESLMDIFGYSTAVQLAGVSRSLSFNTTTEQLLTSREQISPIYGKMKGAGGASISRYMTEERTQGRTSYAVGTTTDSYELHFDKELNAKVQVLAVGRDAQGPEVQVAYAIPGSSLTPIKTSRGEVYHVRLRFVVLDSMGHAVASIDTTRFFLSKTPVPLNEHLVGRAEVHVPPGVHQYRVLIQQGEDAGLILPTDTVRISVAARLSISDLVLGRRANNLGWIASPEDTVYLNPLQTFHRSEDMQLYYEIYGASPGAMLKTEISVKKGGGVKLKFDEPAVGGVDRVMRGISLERLKAGTYTLEVKVTRPDGYSDRRTQQFTVVDP